MLHRRKSVHLYFPKSLLLSNGVEDFLLAYKDLFLKHYFPLFTQFSLNITFSLSLLLLGVFSVRLPISLLINFYV